ncbi:spore coat associated protein CotJA [Brevibacillus sp. NRS-1366]|uniref:spore coat associated protein CotJA n=1 Tax=Brevibacillus sp. NRS-1366 TaxID=3233899 RepID=UPI003D25F25D
MHSQIRTYFPYVSHYDPCPPIRVKTYQVPPELFIPFQPENLPQYPPMEALRLGTLWPALFSPYDPRADHIGRGG